MRYVYQNVVQDGKGNFVAGATVTVTRAGGTTKASIYSALTGGTVDADGVITTGADGTFSFYVDEDDYSHSQQFRIVWAKSGFASETWDYIQIFPDSDRTVITSSSVDQGDDSIVGTLAWHCADLSGASGVIKFLPTTYTISLSIEVDVPQHCTIKAYGASFVFTTDAAGIDLNTSLNTEVRNVRWHGGKFLNSAGTKTSSTALEGRELRLFEVRDCHFQGFGKAIYFEDRDTFIFHNNYFYDNDYAMYCDESAGGNDVGMFVASIKNNHFSINGESGAIYLKGAVSNIEIIGNSFNGDSTTAIFIDNTTADSPAFDLRSFAIRGNHFEQGTGKYLHFNNVSDRAFYALDITNNDFTTATADAIVLEKCQGVHIEANLFGQTSGNGTPIDLDADCLDIYIGRSNVFSTGAIVFACARSEITFQEEYRSVAYSTLTGYGNNSFSTSNATLDMSSIFSGFPTLSGMKPKAYVINITARDENADSSSLVELATTSGVSVGSRSRLSLDGATSDVYHFTTAVVPCDANGDIWLNIVAKAASSLDLYLVVVGYYM